ncbi:hypothetical protein LPJ64_005579, partial [Coemansia asiatica]
MGQAYSHWNSSERQQQPGQPGQPGQAPTQQTSSSMRSGNNMPRAQSTAFRGTGTSDGQRQQRSRFLPYTTGSPRIISRRSEPPSAAIPQAPDTLEPREQPAATQPSSSHNGPEMDLLAAAAAAADAEDISMDASSQMVDDTAASNGTGWRHTRARVRAGNELLSRIVSRSVVNSIAQELDRRNRVLREEQQSPGAESELPSGVTEFQLDIGGGLDLYLNVLMFILSVLESDLDDAIDSPEDEQAVTAASDTVDATAGDSADATAGSSRRQTQGDDTMDTSADGDDEPVSREQNSPTSVLESTNPGMQFRMFLLPGAIEQALDHYA